MVPSYVGSVWLLTSGSTPVKLLKPKKLMKLTELDTSAYAGYDMQPAIITSQRMCVWVTCSCAGAHRV